MYPFSYGRSLGYKYLLQVDKDSHFHEVIKHNLVEVMADGKFDMGARRTGRDEPTWGLPEITKYFLVAEQIQPATLFDHCSPNNIDGLYTVSSRTFSNPEGSDDPLKLIRAEDTGGWDQEPLAAILCCTIWIFGSKRTCRATWHWFCQRGGISGSGGMSRELYQ